MAVQLTSSGLRCFYAVSQQNNDTILQLDIFQAHSTVRGQSSDCTLSSAALSSAAGMQIRNRNKAINSIEALLRELSQKGDSGVQFVEDSRWMSIYRERAFQVSTRHGHPLNPKDEESKHSQPFPWKGLAYLRLARCCEPCFGR